MRQAERSIEKETEKLKLLQSKLKQHESELKKVTQTAEETLEKARKHSPEKEDKFSKTVHQPSELAAILHNKKKEIF